MRKNHAGEEAVTNSRLESASELDPAANAWTSLGTMLLAVAAVGLLCALFGARAPSGATRTYAPLYAFGRAPEAPAGTPGGLVEGSDGALYGTSTMLRETIFRFDPDQKLIKLLHSVSVGDGRQVGLGPRLVACREGFLYGTTASGGAAARGTVFKLRSDGTGFRVLHTFRDTPGEGASPIGRLAVDPRGFIYGTTLYGGNLNRGVLFQLTRDGTDFTVLHHFDAEMDGSNPQAGVILAGRDALFGTTVNGGAFSSGCVFRFDLAERSFSVLHHFGEPHPDGQHPYAELCLGEDNFLYGTTSGGGKFGLGTVFRLATDGSGYALLHQFGGSDGAFPYSALVQGPDQLLYGTAAGGGEMRGTVFRLKLNGDGFRTLHRFESLEYDGANPYTGLALSRGLLYGTTREGGKSGAGTIFALRSP